MGKRICTDLALYQASSDFYKYRAEGKSYEEIAEILQVPVKDIEMTEKALMDYSLYKINESKEK